MLKGATMTLVTAATNCFWSCVKILNLHDIQMTRQPSVSVNVCVSTLWFVLSDNVGSPHQLFSKSVVFSRA